MLGKNRRKSAVYARYEHFEPVFNTATVTQIIFQRSVNSLEPYRCRMHDLFTTNSCSTLKRNAIQKLAMDRQTLE
jgi:hypothetical protein